MSAALHVVDGVELQQERQILTIDGREIELLTRRAQSGVSGMSVVLAHGAGAGMDSPFMQYYGEALAIAGHFSVTFNFPYLHAGRKAPDPAARMIGTWAGVLEWLRDQTEAHADRIVVGGKSMGGRMASLSVSEGQKVAGLALLGYPLHASGKPEKVRIAHFPRLTCPCLFIQGERDTLCKLDSLRAALPTIPGPTKLHVVEGGDHSYAVLKRSGRETSQALNEARIVLLQWIASLPVLSQ